MGRKKYMMKDLDVNGKRKFYYDCSLLTNKKYKLYTQ